MSTTVNHLTVALLQHACGADPEANQCHSEKLLEQAAAAGAQLAVLPELYRSRYFCQTEDAAHFALAEPIPGPTCERLGELARRHRLVIVASLFERRAAGLHHNTAVVVDVDGKLAGRYRKMHIPDDPGFYEKYYFAPGDLGFQPISTTVGKLGLLVCWDQWFPEAARLMATAGAELLIYPTAIGWDPRDGEPERQRQLAAWQISQRAHAVANGLPVLAVNRVGDEPDPSGKTPGLRFWGNSFAVGPQGEMLAQAGDAEEEMLLVELDLQRGETVRRNWPFLRDRRVDHYAELTQLFRDRR